MNLLGRFKAWRRANASHNLLRALTEETGTSALQVVNTVFANCDGRCLNEEYHRSKGELIRVEFSFDPVKLLSVTEEFAEIFGNDQYIPVSFEQPARYETTFDGWLTIDGAYVRTALWYPRMREATSMLHEALRTAEVCATDKHSYYLRRSKMLISDLSQLARVLVQLEGK